MLKKKQFSVRGGSIGVTRRELLRLGPVVVAAAAIPLRASAENEPDPLAVLSRESFIPWVNSSFEAAANGKRTWLTLMSVEDRTEQMAASTRDTWAAMGKKAGTPPPRMDVFALNFYGPPDSLRQGTYTLTHASLGTFPLLLVPEGRSKYSAVINRLLDRQPQA